MKDNLLNKGQALIGIIIVLVIAGLISGGLYYYFSKQIPEVPEITKKPTGEEEVTSPPEEELPKEIPPEEKIEEKPTEEVKPEITCQNECSPAGSKRCSDNGYQTCANYDVDSCLEWSLVTNCPTNTVCQNGSCVQQKCADGTPYKQCSANKPKFCDNGNLVDKCNVCGCLSNYYCDESSILCRAGEKIDMLIFLSPQYSADTQIKQAINDYMNAVKNDVGWDTKIITITSNTNDFRKTDEVIEDYYVKSAKKLKACIMVGEDIHTALAGDFGNVEGPATSPWSTTGGENPNGDENSYTLLSNEAVIQHKQVINIAISLIYPSHTLDYQTKSSQIASVFRKFSEGRNISYPKDITVFIANQAIEETPKAYEVYQVLKDYGNLYYKQEPSQSEINESLTKSYMMYNILGHSNPGYTILGTNSSFQGDYLDKLNTPLFTAGGCNVAGWYAASNQNNFTPSVEVTNEAGTTTEVTNTESITDNGILDFSRDTPWYGSRIFVNSNLRAMVLGFPGQTGDSGHYNFITQAMPELSTGKTLAESIIGHLYSWGDDQIIYGDPTFHYNF